MTPAQAVALIGGVSVVGHDPEIKISAKECKLAEGLSELVIDVRLGPVRDVRNPADYTFITTLERLTCQFLKAYSEADLVEIVRRLCHRAVTHEVDERLRYRGKVVHDPHAGDRR